MKKFILAALSLVLSGSVVANDCSNWWRGIDTVCNKVNDIYGAGKDSVYVSGWAYHARFQYTREKLSELNEFAWGGGWGRHIEHTNGNEEGIYMTVFSDSHRDAQFNAGYMWMPYWKVSGKLKAGAGFTAALVSRADMLHHIPFPIALPVLSIQYKPVTIYSTFIPSIGGVNNGSVLYSFARIEY